MALHAASQKVVEDFTLSDDNLHKIVKEFIVEMSAFRQRSCAIMILTGYRGGTREERHDHEPNPHIRYGSTRRNREGGH